MSLTSLESAEEENLWVEFNRLTAEHNAVNLGTGFPDFLPPYYVTSALAQTALSNDVSMHNYTRASGHLRLVNVLAKFFSKLIKRSIDPMNELLVSIGADGSLFSAMMAFVNPGDEVILIEPFFDSYEPFVTMAGGVPVFVPLTLQAEHSQWILDPEKLTNAFNSKTKAIIVNTPQNPTGKVFSGEELGMIAKLATKWDVLVVMDEVYEWLAYDRREHVRMATLPGMWERTITVGSAGKTFCVTGWKVGWAYGPKNLIHWLQNVHQDFVGSCPTPLQEGVAIGFELEIQRLNEPECFFNQFPKLMESKRDKMVRILKDVGMNPIVPEGGYFIIANFTEVGAKLGTEGKCTLTARDFCRWLIKTKKVSVLPLTTFCKEGHKYLAENYVRICFIKMDETLEAAERNLRNLQLP